MTENKMYDIQLGQDGKLKHLLCIETLPISLIHQILDKAASYLDGEQLLENSPHSLQNKAIANCFFEPSTRTRVSFELAAKRFGAHVVNFNVMQSSIKKGETVTDTIETLEAMGFDAIVMRHQENYAPFSVVQAVNNTVIINAGDGNHAHPTQALLDAYTIRHYCKEFHGLVVSIVGDVLHSRVANSLVSILKILGVKEIRVVAPENLLPTDPEKKGIQVFQDIGQGLQDADVVIGLRLQKERMETALIPNTEEYFAAFGITQERLQCAKPSVIVMHPGPINREVEIASDVANGPQSVIKKQVTFGVAVRMAVMEVLLK